MARQAQRRDAGRGEDSLGGPWCGCAWTGAAGTAALGNARTGLQRRGLAGTMRLGTATTILKRRGLARQDRLGGASHESARTGRNGWARESDATRGYDRGGWAVHGGAGNATKRKTGSAPAWSGHAGFERHARACRGSAGEAANGRATTRVDHLGLMRHGRRGDDSFGPDTRRLAGMDSRGLVSQRKALQEAIGVSRRGRCVVTRGVATQGSAGTTWRGSSRIASDGQRKAGIESRGVASPCAAWQDRRGVAPAWARKDRRGRTRNAWSGHATIGTAGSAGHRDEACGETRHGSRGRKDSVRRRESAHGGSGIRSARQDRSGDEATVAAGPCMAGQDTLGGSLLREHWHGRATQELKRNAAPHVGWFATQERLGVARARTECCGTTRQERHRVSGRGRDPAWLRRKGSDETRLLRQPRPAE